MGEVVRDEAVKDARTALAAMGRLYAADLAPPARVEISGQLAVRQDAPGLALLLLDRDWCERTQEILAAQPADNGAPPSPAPRPLKGPNAGSGAPIERMAGP